MFLTKDEAVKELEKLDGVLDPEKDHSEADGILLSQVPIEVKKAYLQLQERAMWW